MTAIRRARPALGTLVELGFHTSDAGAEPAWASTVIAAGWRAIAEVEAAMSAFLPASDVARFNQASVGARIDLRPETAVVLRTAQSLQRVSGGAFDVTTGTGPAGWAIEKCGPECTLQKLDPYVRLDLGGIAKGYAVDRALEAITAQLERKGAPIACWVNAGGDLRARGLDLPVFLRDERGGGARPWIVLREGAVATSDFGASPGRLSGATIRAPHVSVASPRCLWSDALTKVVALSGKADHPAVLRLDGHAWIHA